MHNDPELTEQRLAPGAATSACCPAVHARSVPLTVEVWHVPGEPVPVGEALAAAYEPARGRRPVGPALGHQLVPGQRHRARRSGPGCPSRRSLDLGFGTDQPGFSSRGPGLPAGRHPGEGLNPRNTWLPVGRPAAGGEEVRAATSRRPPTRSSCSTTRSSPSRPRRSATARRGCQTATTAAGGEPLYRLRRMDLAVFDAEVWELVHDLEVLGAADARAARRTRRGAGRSCARSSARWTRSTCRTSPAPRPRPARELAPALAAPAARVARTGSPRSATRTSTRPGCGRCARPSARWPAPSPTSPR